MLPVHCLVTNYRDHEYPEKLNEVKEPITPRIWNILFTAPRIKMIVILNLLRSKFVETMSDVSICFYRS